MIHEAMSVAAAFVRWVSAGSPMRTKAEQERILAEFCLQCEFYNHNRRACELCGCGMRINGNKLLWATESCPFTPPRWRGIETNAKEANDGSQGEAGSKAGS